MKVENFHVVSMRSCASSRNKCHFAKSSTYQKAYFFYDEGGTHWVRYEGENVLRVVQLSEAKYSCADNAQYLSWVALARGGGRRAR